jgi:23S rRNA (cytidine1920-2'-O)/16S rRNA (cytidine1409-2'-O)-methyltransferase
VLVAERAGCSRERAQALILAGDVRVAGVPKTKAGALVDEDAQLEIAGAARFVSRGGFKLEHALQEFGWQVEGLKCLDVGASTGGFTDCLLQRGAASVTAVDVGYGQLDWRLRNDPRVHVVERQNFRYADVAVLGAPFAFACADVSFISLTKLFANFAAALAPDGRAVFLIKPQFEAGRAAVGSGGVVRDPSAQVAAIENVMDACAAAGLTPRMLTHSPIKGPAGNIEFLLGATRFVVPTFTVGRDVLGRASLAQKDVVGRDVLGRASLAQKDVVGRDVLGRASLAQKDVIGRDVLGRASLAQNNDDPDAPAIDVAGAVRRAHETLDP